MPPEESLRNAPEVHGGASNVQLDPTSPQVQPPLSEGNGSPNNNIFSQWLATTLAGSHSKKDAATGKGVYVGVGLTPIPDRLACRIRQDDFIDMGELLLESWPLQQTIE